MKILLVTLCLAFSHTSAPTAPIAPQVKAKQHNIGYVVLEGEVNDESVSKIIHEMRESLVAHDEAVMLRINSPGGSVDSGFLLTRLIEEYPNPVVCVVDGEADSMAMYIFQSCDVRIMTKRSSLMIHEPAVSGYIRSGQPSDLQSLADHIKALSAAMAEHLCGKMNCSVSYLMQRIAGGRQWWLNWQDAKAWKATDLVVQSVKEVQKALESGSLKHLAAA